MSKEKQADWTEEAEWTKAPPVRTAEDDRANELLQAGFMAAMLKQCIDTSDGRGNRVGARIFLHALRPCVAETLVTKWAEAPKYVREEWEAIKAHDQLPIT